MRKILLVSITLIALFSCSKDENTSAPPPPLTTNPVVVAPKEVSFKLTPQPHEGGFANFQTGEVVGYKVEITDENNDSGTYILTPDGQDQTKHQIEDTDYVFGDYESTITNPKPSLENISYVLKTGEFKIKILKPGTFTLKFDLQKFVAGKKVGFPISQIVYFSAVTFGAGSNYKSFSSTVQSRRFLFGVNCGDEVTDTYLTDAENFTYTYQTEYNKTDRDGKELGGMTGNLIDSYKEFSPYRDRKSFVDDFLSSTFNVIVTVKSKNGELTNVIKYSNIKPTYDNGDL
jgi:hypothetical protein